MKITKEKITQNNRNNLSSLNCHTCSFANLSRNNNSDIIWRQWNNK